jgi:hypothetical protein
MEAKFSQMLHIMKTLKVIKGVVVGTADAVGAVEGSTDSGSDMEPFEEEKIVDLDVMIEKRGWVLDSEEQGSSRKRVRTDA